MLQAPSVVVFGAFVLRLCACVLLWFFGESTRPACVCTNTHAIAVRAARWPMRHIVHKDEDELTRRYS